VKQLATAALVLTAISGPTAVALYDREDADLWVRTELFFGTEKPGPDVTDQQFSRFVNDTVTPRFPDGLTVLDGNGQWRDSSGRIVRERSKVLILLYPGDSAGDSNRKIEEIRDAYEKRFQQESVLRADSEETVSF
jgi:hypothetical protein